MGKVKEFVKKHRDAVPYVIGAGIGLTLLSVAGVKAKSNANNVYKVKELDHPELDEGWFNWYNVVTEGDKKGVHGGEVLDVPLSDLGKVGDKLKECEGLNENSKISFLFTDEPAK